MTRAVEFLFDVGSPTTYLAYTQLPSIAAAVGARIAWTPMLLGAVFKATGNASPVMVPAKGAYMGADMARFARRYGVPLALNPHFPINTTTIMRGATALLDAEADLRRYLNAVFTAMWEDRRDLGDRAVLAEVMASAGFDPEDLLARAETDAIKARLRANTDGAVARGVFGAPSFFVGDVLFFGQDRLDFVREALEAA